MSRSNGNGTTAQLGRSAGSGEMWIDAESREQVHPPQIWS